jgi:hypothetical protein
MRMLLRDKETHLYFQGPDRWTADPARAFDFRFLERAIEYCETWHLAGVELAFVYDRPEQVIVVPLESAARQVAMA